MGAGASTGEGSPTSEDVQRLSAHFLGHQRLFVIGGLTSAVGEELNGRLGEVKSVDPRTGRLAVKLLPGDPQSKWKLLRHQSLTPSPLQVTGDADVCCSICLEDASSEEDGPLVRACSCRGSSGATHLGCCLKAFAATASHAPGAFPTCPTCKSQYHPKVAVTLLLAHAADLQSKRESPATEVAASSSTATTTSAATSVASASAAATVAPLQFGALVRIHSLTTATRLNGMRGLAIERDARSLDRWLVQLEDGSVKAIREANLTRQSVHADGSVRDGADGTGGIEAAMVAAQARLAARQGLTGGGVGRGAIGGGGESLGEEAEAPPELTLRVLGMAYHAAGQSAMAVRSLRESVRLSEARYGKGHPAVALALSGLGVALLDGTAEEAREAVGCLERSLALREAAEEASALASARAMAAASSPFPAVASGGVSSTLHGGGGTSRVDKPEHVATLLALAKAYRLRGDPEASRALLLRCLAAHEVMATEAEDEHEHGEEEGQQSTSDGAAASSGGAEPAASASSSPSASKGSSWRGAESAGAVSTSILGGGGAGRREPRLSRGASEAVGTVLEELSLVEAALAKQAEEAAREEAEEAIEAAVERMTRGESRGAEGLPVPGVEAEVARCAGARAAAHHLMRAVEMREHASGSRHEGLVPLLRQLGERWAAAREPRRAAEALERALDLAEVSGGGGAASVGGDDALAALLSQLRAAYEAMGETAKAEQAKQRSLALWSKSRKSH